MGRKSVPLIERFDRHYIPEPMSGCWLWLSATISSRGGGPYGIIRNEIGLLPLQKLAHRASYELYVGKIPEGREIDHVCRNTLCVNPDHLEPITHKAHVRRTYDRARNGNCKRGHLMDEKNSWIEKTGQKHCRRCHADRERVNKKRNKLLTCAEVLP